MIQDGEIDGAGPPCFRGRSLHGYGRIDCEYAGGEAKKQRQNTSAFCCRWFQIIDYPFAANYTVYIRQAHK